MQDLKACLTWPARDILIQSNCVCYKRPISCFTFVKKPLCPLLSEMKTSRTIFIFICVSFLFQNTSSTDTLGPNQSLHHNQTLISNGETFELGFFSLGKFDNNYLGIWYKITPHVIVWVANRNTPLPHSQGVLTLYKNGTLTLVNNSSAVIWSSSNGVPVTSPVVKLLDTGNLVVQNDSDANSGTYIWQSFDFPGNTRLPGMLMGENLENGLDIQINSWKSEDDPSPGDFVYKIQQVGLSQLVIEGNGTKRYRSGPWNGICFNGLTTVGNPPFRGITDSANRAKVVYITAPYNASYINRLILTPTGYVERYILDQEKNEWKYSLRLPDNPCDLYGQCGPNGICNLSQKPLCRCLDRLVPKSEQEWKSQNWTSGCERSDSSSDCLHKGNDTFIRVSSAKLPDLLKFQMKQNMNLSDCQSECLRNCSCNAYANPYVNSPESACLMWYGDLLDIREYNQENNEQIFYARVPLPETGYIVGFGEKGKLSQTLIIGVSTALGISSLALIFVCIAIKRRQRGMRRKKRDIELPLFQFSAVASATKNFSSANLIGEGGFGPVYKGQLSTGQEVAVKRLSKNSGQGIEEFRNEVASIAKLQHRNLVRLLGCCIQGEERMLIYEYMQNNCLDHFIFDETRKTLLTWPMRFSLILGIARGLQYLHQDSRLKIIHRDLKTSNILLDTNLIPKISDFGLARIFGLDQDFAKTKRVIGTYGYMAPEYAIDGKFSAKSDVFSMGVMILEIISGTKNRNFSHPDHHHTLLGHAWLLWSEDRALEMMDSCLEDSYMEDQVQRCIRVGLLCVQKLVEDRPEMSSVVFMLSKEEAILPQPKEPGFFTERSTITVEASHTFGSEAFGSEESNTVNMKNV